MVPDGRLVYGGLLQFPLFFEYLNFQNGFAYIVGPGRAHMGPYGSIWALMGPRCAHVGPFGPKGFCFNHLRVFVKRRGGYWQPVRTLCGYLVFFLTLEVIIHPKWQKSETNFKNCPDFCDLQLISLVRIPVVSL